MKKITLIHPYKLKRIMAEFITEVFTIEAFKPGKDIAPRMDYIEGYNNFGVCADAFFKGTTDNNIVFKYDPSIFIGAGSRNYKDGLGFIMSNMCERANYMRGFSQATRVLLHEIGHIMTWEKLHEEYTEEKINRLHYRAMFYGGNSEYIKIPDEWAATQWAIDWLSVPDNRRMAKNFEKKFWSCFRKE